jgi:hypothetical protein
MCTERKKEIVRMVLPHSVKTYEVVYVKIQVFLTSPLFRGECLALHSGRFTLMEIAHSTH